MTNQAAVKDLERAERNVARVAREVERAIDYFRTARDVRNAGEYRNDMADLLAALDEWKEAEAQFYATLDPIPQSKATPATYPVARKDGRVVNVTIPTDD